MSDPVWEAGNSTLTVLTDGKKPPTSSPLETRPQCPAASAGGADGAPPWGARGGPRVGGRAEPRGRLPDTRFPQGAARRPLRAEVRPDWPDPGDRPRGRRARGAPAEGPAGRVTGEGAPALPSDPPRAPLPAANPARAQPPEVFKQNPFCAPRSRPPTRAFQASGTRTRTQHSETRASRVWEQEVCFQLAAVRARAGRKLVPDAGGGARWAGRRLGAGRVGGTLGGTGSGESRPRGLGGVALRHEGRTPRSERRGEVRQR